MNDPDIRRMLDTARAVDRPTGVDRDALLRKILAAPPAPPTRDGVWVAAAGALAVAAVVGVLAWPTPPERVRPVERMPVAPVAAVVAPPAVAPVAAPRAPVAVPSVAAVEPSVPAAAAHRAAPLVRAAGDEWQIIRDADRALREHAPDRALAVLARHAVEHPRGVASTEVLAYRVRAYCMAGRAAEALDVARELRARAPTSPAAYSLRATCAAEPSSR